MANWNDGIKLLLSSYDGDSIELTSRKNDLSDFIKNLGIEKHFEFLFLDSNNFDRKAFDSPPGGSTKGTNLQHYFNNFALSPSRSNDELKDELNLIKENDKIRLPLKDNYVRSKWLSEASKNILKRMSHVEFNQYKKQFESSPIPFVNIFDYRRGLNNTSRAYSHTKVEPINVVFYGPPGTGKTRAAHVLANSILFDDSNPLDYSEVSKAEYPKDFAKNLPLNYFSAQFHPSYSYEDFIEGLRPLTVKSGDKEDIAYIVLPGAFKVACQLARANLEPNVYGIPLSVQYSAESDGTGCWDIGPRSNISLYHLLKRDGYLSYQGKKVLATGSFSDDQIESKDLGLKTGLYQLEWYSASNNVENFIFFIDEFNRGNPAKIFGEALSLLEVSKRYGRRESSEIYLPYSREKLTVPPNLHVIATMNSADKSLMTLDQAFRRRFRFVYFPPMFELVKTEKFKNQSQGIFSDSVLDSLVKHFTTVNDALIATGVPQENLIGHSYLFEVLSNSFLEVGNSDEAKRPAIIRKNLMKLWTRELHSQIREIVGDYKLEDFCENFANLTEEVSENIMYLIGPDDISKGLHKYLSNIDPKVDRFPWKAA